jgi:hypothetical protein
MQRQGRPMRITSLLVLFFLAGGLGLHRFAAGAPIADGQKSVADRPAGAAEPVAENVVLLRFKSESGVPDNDGDQALLAAAGEIAESTNRSQRTRVGRLIELKEAVRIWLKDDTVKTRADRAVVILADQKKSDTVIEKLTVTLSGDAHWESDGVEVSADELTISIRQRFQNARSTPPMIEWTVCGKAKILGSNFEGRADNVELQSFYEYGQPNRRAMSVALDGNGSLRRRGAAGKNRMEGEKMKFSLVLGRDGAEFPLFKPGALNINLK